MLSYRHAFHAGNHGDVLKHLVLIQTIEYVRRKEKPFVYIDTHAGAGNYDLLSEWAQKNCEYSNGIARLWRRADLPPSINDYLNLVKKINPTAKLRRYPGSPWIAKQLMRPCDKCRVFELHPNEVQNLRATFAGDRSVMIDNIDGYEALKSLLPPEERRAVVLIDPSYENKADFTRVVSVLQDAYRRFATGVYLIWYPVIWRKYIRQLENSLLSSGIRNILLCELLVAPDETKGLTGSGMLVVNPPWVLKDNMKVCLPYLADVLAQGNTGQFRLEMLVEQ